MNNTVAHNAVDFDMAVTNIRSMATSPTIAMKITGPVIFFEGAAGLLGLGRSEGQVETERSKSTGEFR